MEMEMVRKIILEQDAQFREQVRELHRLYRVQKLLLEEVRQRGIEQAARLGGGDCSRLELASGFPGDDDGSRKKSDAQAAAAPPPAARRRTFDLELPAEEYMDVEMEEPSSTNRAACDLVSKLNGAAPLASVGVSMNSVKNLDLSSAVHGANEKVGSERIDRGGSRDGETEIFQMIKRAKSSDGGFKQQQVPCSPSTQGILGGIWGYGFDTATSGGAARNAAAAVEKSRANGFYIRDDKGSKQQQEVLSLNSKAAPENQHVVFLEPGQHRFPADNGKALGSTGMESFNPFFASAAAAAAAAAMERNSSEENGKYGGGAFGAALGGPARLQNHVSYSSQGILIPSTNMARRESSSPSSSSFLEPPGLGLWWKSNSNYYQQQQPQYQQVAVLQAGTPAQSVAAVQVAWQNGSGFATSPSSYNQHHGAMLAVVPPPVANFIGKDENGGSGNGNGGSGWLKGGPGNGSGGVSAPGFHYCGGTPPKPPFKKPPKLILDGATMELKLAPLDRDRPPVVGFLRQNIEETVVAPPVTAATEQQCKRGDAAESPAKEAEVSNPELEQDREELKLMRPDLALLPPPSTLSSENPSERPKCSEEVAVDAGVSSEHIKTKEETEQIRGVVKAQYEEHVVKDEKAAEADLGRCEEAPSCNCSQPGCPLCDTGSVEDVQVKQRSGKIEKVAGKNCLEQQAREEVRDSTESEQPPPSTTTSSKKRRFKLVTSKDLLATRESGSGGSSGKKTEAIAEELDARTGELSSREGEAEKKKKKGAGTSSKSSRSSSKSELKQEAKQDKASRTSPPVNSRHKDKGGNGFSCLADNADDGANLAAEILVSLAPAKREAVPADRNGGVIRVHHKSKRRFIDTLPTTMTTTTNHHHLTPDPPPPPPPLPPPKASPVVESVKDESRKKKKKSKSSSKSLVAKLQESEEEAKGSAKSGRVAPALSQCESAGVEAHKSSSKHRKKLVTKKPQPLPPPPPPPPPPHQTPPKSSRVASGSREIVANGVASSLPKGREGRDHGYQQQQQQHERKLASSRCKNEAWGDQQEALDRLSQQQQQHSGENSSEEITGKESDEEWARRSWGASARRKRMRRSKRAGL